MRKQNKNTKYKEPENVGAVHTHTHTHTGNLNKKILISVGILVAIYIFKEGYELIHEHSMILLDSQDEKLLDEIKYIILGFDEIENAHDYHMTKSGESIFIYADVRVNSKMTVEEAHELTDEISKKIRNKYRNIKKVLLHIEPMYK